MKAKHKQKHFEFLPLLNINGKLNFLQELSKSAFAFAFEQCKSSLFFICEHNAFIVISTNDWCSVYLHASLLLVCPFIGEIANYVEFATSQLFSTKDPTLAKDSIRHFHNQSTYSDATFIFCWFFRDTPFLAFIFTRFKNAFWESVKYLRTLLCLKEWKSPATNVE